MTILDTVARARPAVRRSAPWRRDALVAAVVAATAFVPTIDRVAMRPTAPVVLTTPLLLVVPALAIAVLTARRRHPLVVLIATTVLFGIGAVASGQVLPFVAPVVIAVFTAASRLPRRATLILAGVAVLVVAGIEVAALRAEILDPRSLAPVVLVVASAAAGDASRSRREYLAAVTERAERAERTREAEARRRVAEERLRIARDLHDAVAHQTTVINLHAGVAAAAVARDEVDVAAARVSLGIIGSASQAILAEIKDLLGTLRSADEPIVPPADESVAPPAVATGGLAALDALTASFAAAGLPLTTRVEGSLDGVPDRVGRVAYQVVREGLTNARKHSGGRTHLLLTRTADRLGVVLTSRIEPALAVPTPSAGLGLVGMRERVGAAHGTLRAELLGDVYRLSADLPLAAGPGTADPGAADPGAAAPGTAAPGTAA